MTTDREMLGVRIPEDLKRLVDADARHNQEAVEAALWDEYGGQRQSAIEKRLEHKEARIVQIKREIADLESELEEVEGEKQSLEAQLAEMESTQQAYRNRVGEIAEAFATSTQVLPSFRSDIQDVSEEFGVPLDDVEADIREWVADSGHDVDEDRYTDTYGDGL